ncbi:MAG: CoA ester lyase, partial [Candidatus Thiodiazotropha sp. (ex Lucinoma annulata)]|nr:CoA ester lyase [Candidatus Thiodiazotropha sp. (ex Lucinoma annulata)]
SQIALANQVFTPGKVEAERARRIIAAMQEAATAGMGAVSLDGRMIDAASIRQAEVVIEKMAQIERITGREAVA